MRNISFVLGVVVLSILATSCEKIIDVNIKDADKKYVIEANVSNITTQPPEVKISRTSNFSDENGFNGVSGASVTIKVNNNAVYTLSETTPGVYRTTAFTGFPDSTYTLAVTINGLVYTATSVMPKRLVKLDSLTVDNFSFGGSSNYIIRPSYLDPVGLGNSYRLIQYVNNKLVKTVFVQNDALSDGLTITRPLVGADTKLKKGDNVRVDLLCVAQNVYTYFYSLGQAASGSGNNATPANPVSNISGDALGYFSAYSVTSQTVVIP